MSRENGGGDEPGRPAEGVLPRDPGGKLSLHLPGFGGRELPRVERPGVQWPSFPPDTAARDGGATDHTIAVGLDAL